MICIILALHGRENWMDRQRERFPVLLVGPCTHQAVRSRRDVMSDTESSQTVLAWSSAWAHPLCQELLVEIISDLLSENSSTEEKT